MPALRAVGAPGLLGGGGGGVRGRGVLVQVSGPGVLHLRGVYHVLAVVGQLDVSLEVTNADVVKSLPMQNNLTNSKRIKQNKFILDDKQETVGNEDKKAEDDMH